MNHILDPYHFTFWPMFIFQGHPLNVTLLFCTIIIRYKGHKLLYLSDLILEKLIYIIYKIEVCLCDLPLFHCCHFGEQNEVCHTCHQDTVSALMPRYTMALGVPVN